MSHLNLVPIWLLALLISGCAGLTESVKITKIESTIIDRSSKQKVTKQSDTGQEKDSLSKKQPAQSPGQSIGQSLENNNRSKKTNIADICSIFRTMPHWYASAKQAEKRWNVPLHVSMAIIRQESAFKHDARPLRLVSGSYRPASSAFGFSQALDGTWKEYKLRTGSSTASRQSFADSIDFVGWYLNQSYARLNIPKWKTYEHYLAYHEGIGGFERGTYKRKAWLKKVAQKVSKNGIRYSKQLKNCESEIVAIVKALPNTQLLAAKDFVPSERTNKATDGQTIRSIQAVKKQSVTSQPTKKTQCVSLFVFIKTCSD